MLKYDTVRAKLLKCSEGRPGANLLKWVTPPAKLLNHGSKHGNTRGYLKKSRENGYFAVFGCLRKKVFAPWGRSKTLKLALPGGGRGEQNC